MYAIVEVGGSQCKVEPGTRFTINRLTAAVGESHVVDQVLFARDGDKVTIGKPYIPGAQVVCEIEEHKLGPKLVAFQFRRRENWRRKVGHRQSLTRLVVKEILLEASSGKTAKKAKASSKEKE